MTNKQPPVQVVIESWTFISDPSHKLPQLSKLYRVYYEDGTSECIESQDDPSHIIDEVQRRCSISKQEDGDPSDT